MSVQAMTWVLEKSETTLGPRLVLLALANHARGDGTGAWPAVETLAREARLSRRAVQSALRKLEAEGAIRLMGTSSKGTRIWAVVMGGAESAPRVVDDAAGAQNSSSGGEAASPEPSIEPSKEPNTSPEGSPREPVELSEWLGHHHEITRSIVPKAGTQARKKIASMFAARIADGLSLDDLRHATLGAWNDEWRRAEGHFGHESVLRPTKCHELVSKGRRWAAAQAAAEGDVTRSRTRWEDLDG